MSNYLEVIILAAGQGTRMRSSLPKVLHPLAGKPLLGHVLDTARQLEPTGIHVVYGYGGKQVIDTFEEESVHWAEQVEQLGTGHAVAAALPGVAAEATALILYGDVPLIGRNTLQRLVNAVSGDRLVLLTALLDDPHGYGRILRDRKGRVQRIVEQKDATAEERSVCEVNTGMMAMPAARLKEWLGRIENDNVQGEYYLTDIIALARADGVAVEAVIDDDLEEILGVNDRVQLAALERSYQRRRAEELMRDGTMLIDPARFDLRGTLRVGRDVRIDVNVLVEGEVALGDGVTIGANCILRDTVIGEGTTVEPMSIIEQARIGPNCQVGPFARIRPGTEMAEGAKVGNFVEVKKSRIGPGSKVNHLSYIGDTTMGSDVNVGAGTITCNYDGANKHQTVIGDAVFIGSDTQLVAPVDVADGTTIGAGSTITKDTPVGELTLSRSKQITIKGWKRPIKKSG